MSNIPSKYAIDIPPVHEIDPRLVYRPPDNPNRLTPEAYEQLLGSIRRLGFVVPVLVVPGLPDGVEGDWEYTVVDGDHRTQAMIELEAPWYRAIIANDYEEAQRLIGRLGLNRIRGSLDLTDVGRDLKLIIDLCKDAEQEMDDYDAVLGSGFDEDEMRALLDAAEPEDDESILGATPESEPPAGVQRGGAKKSLTLKFSSAVDCVRVTESLVAAAGDTEDPADGVLALLGLTHQPDVEKATK